jgi:hypothetical protein
MMPPAFQTFTLPNQGCLRQLAPALHTSMLLAVALCIVGQVSAQSLISSQVPEQRRDDGAIVVKKNGSDAFRYLLDQQGIEPIGRPDTNIDDPRNTIIILLGNSLDLDMAVVNAVKGGASILIATDRRDDRLSRYFDVNVTGAQVMAQPPDCFYHEENPFVWPVKGRRDDSARTVLFKDIDNKGETAIATERPSALHWQGQLPLQPLAHYPRSATFKGGAACETTRDFFAVGGTLGAGRVLILADRFVFANWLILALDNANYDFACNCIEWLQGPNKKTRCLFVEGGDVQMNFRLPTLSRHDNLLEWVIKAALIAERHGDRQVEKLEDDDFFNRLVQTRFSTRQIVRAVVIFMTLALVAVGFVRFVRGRARPDPARTLVTPDLAFLIPRGNVLRQRFQGLIDAENVYEPARRLVRDMMAGLGAGPDDQGRPPDIVIQDGQLDPGGLRRRIQRLWQIGFGHEPVLVRPEEWRKLTQELEEVLECADNGWWRFAPVRTT